VPLMGLTLRKQGDPCVRSAASQSQRGLIALIHHLDEIFEA